MALEVADHRRALRFQDIRAAIAATGLAEGGSLDVERDQAGQRDHARPSASSRRRVFSDAPGSELRQHVCAGQPRELVCSRGEDIRLAAVR